MKPQDSSRDMPTSEVPKVAIDGCEERMRGIIDRVGGIDKALERHRSDMSDLDEERENLVIEAGEIGEFLTSLGQTEKRWKERVKLIHDGEVDKALQENLAMKTKTRTSHGFPDDDVPF